MSRKTQLRKREGYTVDDPSVIDEINARLRKLMRTNATGKKIRLRKRDIKRIAKAVTRNMKAVEFKMCLRREDGDHNEPPADSLVGVDGRYYRQTPDAGASGANDGSALYYTGAPVKDAPKFKNAEGYTVDKPSVVDEIVVSTLDGDDSKSDASNRPSVAFDVDFAEFINGLRAAVDALRSGGKSVGICASIPVDDIECHIDGVVRAGAPDKRSSGDVTLSTVSGDSKSDIESKLFSYKEMLDARDRAFADGFCCGRKRNDTESEEITIKESNPIIKFVDAAGHEYSVKTIGHSLDAVESKVERAREFPR